jgi:hypothetical protein
MAPQMVTPQMMPQMMPQSPMMAAPQMTPPAGPMAMPSHSMIPNLAQLQQMAALAASLPLPIPQTPPPRASQPSVVDEELSSVHGGNTASAVLQAAADSRSSMRWTISVLGIATVLGAIAAVAVQLAPGRERDDSASEEPGPNVASSARSSPTPVNAQIPAINPPLAPSTVAVAPASANATIPPGGQASTAAGAPPAPTVVGAAVPSGQPATAAQTVAPGRSPASTPTAESPPRAQLQAPPPVQPPTSADRKIERVTSGSGRTPPLHLHSRPANEGTLRVQTLHNTYATITVENSTTQFKGEIPDGKFTLSPGRYRVRLMNKELDLYAECSVRSVEAGRVTVVKASMEEGTCWVDK